MVEPLSTVCRCFGYIDDKKTPLRQRKLPRVRSRTNSSKTLDYDDDVQHIELSDEKSRRNNIKNKTKHKPKKHSWVSDKDSSIVIIGGNEAGIHMASILIRAGFNNIKIMEIAAKNDENGHENGYGTSNSITDSEYEIIHELGTAYIHRNYDAFFELIGLYDDSNNELIPINNSKCNIQINNTNLCANQWINNHKKAAAIKSAAVKYIKLYTEIFEADVEKIKLKSINMSFLKFINKHQLNALLPYFVYHQTLMEGFGNLDEIAAYYGLFWNNKTSIQNTLINNHGNVDNLWCLSKGFQHLFSSIISAEEIDICYSAEITSINRYLNDVKHKICIMYNDNANDSEKLIECDVLFCAADVQNILPLISDISQQEFDIFNSITSHTMCVTLFECDILAKNDKNCDNLLLFYPNNLLKKNGNVFKIRNSSKIINGIRRHDKIILEKGLKKERFICYQMINNNKKNEEENVVSDVKFGEILLGDLKELNVFKNVTILKQNIFPYCTQWNRKDIQNGIPWFVEKELQGKYKNMYYIGSSVCFQSIESILQYNIQLQQKLNL